MASYLFQGSVIGGYVAGKNYATITAVPAINTPHLSQIVAPRHCKKNETSGALL